MSVGLISFVQSELVRLPADRHPNMKNADMWICCPLHAGGMERTPSAKINLDPTAPAPIGHFYCFGCSQKMHWNDFAALFGLKGMTKGQIRESQATTFVNDDEEPIPPDYKLFAKWPEVVPWRGIDGKIVKWLKGRSVQFGRHSRMYIPVTLYGENMGGIYCALQGAVFENDKSYVNTSGEWSARSLIGFDVARKMTGPLLVVEGSRDVGHTLMAGWRTVGLIGSKISKEKVSLIKDLDPPSILIATDPDDAGDNARDSLLEELDGLIPTKVFPMRRDKETGKKLEDPADISLKKWRKARKAMIKLFGEG